MDGSQGNPTMMALEWLSAADAGVLARGLEANVVEVAQHEGTLVGVVGAAHRRAAWVRFGDRIEAACSCGASNDICEHLVAIVAATIGRLSG